MSKLVNGHYFSVHSRPKHMQHHNGLKFFLKQHSHFIYFLEANYTPGVNFGFQKSVKIWGQSTIQISMYNDLCMLNMDEKECTNISLWGSNLIPGGHVLVPGGHQNLRPNFASFLEPLFINISNPKVQHLLQQIDQYFDFRQLFSQYPPTLLV